MTSPEDCLAAAAEIEDRFPGPAAALRNLAAPIENPDRREFRRSVLRRIWRTRLRRGPAFFCILRTLAHHLAHYGLRKRRPIA